jgi:HlyD family secretion protein
VARWSSDTLNTLKRYWLLFLLVALAVAGLAAFSFRKSDAPKFFTTSADRGDIRQVVEATGTINAVTTVQVGSQVSGTIAHLGADFNSRVRKGQVIAQIDPALFQGTVLQTRADLANARASLAAAKANLEKAKASAVQTKADYARNVGLAREGVVSQQQLDLAKANADSAEAAVDAAAAQVTQAAAQVEQRQAAVAVSETNLRYTTILAPIDGTVVARNVDVGQTVAASLQAPTLFTIAQDLTKMQVYAKTDESDVGMIRAGQPVTFQVDAYPKEVFTGRVSQVRMNATTVQNVVTYDTVIDFDNPGQKLFPGMTAYVTLPVAAAQNVLRVPNGALRFKPDMKPEEIRALFQKYGLAGNTATAHENGNSGGAEGRQARARATTAGAADSNRPPRVDVGTVWKLRPDQTLEPVRVRVGITDHTLTEVAEVLRGTLKENDALVTGTLAASGGARVTPGISGGATPRR